MFQINVEMRKRANRLLCFDLINLIVMLLLSIFHVLNVSKMCHPVAPLSRYFVTVEEELNRKWMFSCYAVSRWPRHIHVLLLGVC